LRRNRDLAHGSRERSFELDRILDDPANCERRPDSRERSEHRLGRGRDGCTQTPVIVLTGVLSAFAETRCRHGVNAGKVRAKLCLVKLYRDRALAYLSHGTSLLAIDEKGAGSAVSITRRLPSCQRMPSPFGEDS